MFEDIFCPLGSAAHKMDVPRQNKYTAWHTKNVVTKPPQIPMTQATNKSSRNNNNNNNNNRNINSKASEMRVAVYMIGGMDSQCCRLASILLFLSHVVSLHGMTALQVVSLHAKNPSSISTCKSMKTCNYYSSHPLPLLLF
jgi:hypothetical protein